MKAKAITCLLLILALLSCRQKKEKTNTIIEGKIPELASQSIQINTKDSTYKTTTDNHGKFQLDIILEKPQYIYIKSLDRRLFLLPNNRISIKKQDDKYVFSGSQSALINNYYSNWNTYNKKVSDTANFKAYYNQSPHAFLKSVNKWIEVYKQPLYKLQKMTPDLNSDFLFFENERIKYMLYSDLNNYRNNSRDIPDDFYKYLNKINLNDPNLIQLDEYRYFLSSYIRMKVNRLNLKDKAQETSKILDIVRETFQNEFILNEISYKLIREQTGQLAIDSTLINRFKNICTNSEYITTIENIYKTLKPLLKGNKAPDFELIGLKRNKVTLENFSGKYLLIDVWSTTCTPCIKEFPFIEKLKQKLKGKNIEIIAACLSGEKAWKATLTKHGLTNNQFRIEKGWNSEFRQDYLKASGVPVYILIDPDGKIIDARAPKPSGNLYDVIKKLET
jgi:peroxiredoxin